MKSELMLFWTAVGLYGLSTFSYIFGMIARQEKLFTIGQYAALFGFIPHVTVIGLRWSATGISPFISISESLTLGVFMTVLLFLVFQFSTKKVQPLGVLVMPVAFVLMGWAGTLMKEVAATLAPALQSGWIWVHIVGASGGFAAVLIAADPGFDAARILAKEYGLEDDVCFMIDLAARMHDIGKLGYPDSMLGKPTSLYTPNVRFVEIVEDALSIAKSLGASDAGDAGE